MRVTVIGATGQLGTDVVRVLSEDHEVSALAHADIEVADPGSVKEGVAGTRPDAVVNCAAFHKVDACEDDPAQAFAVNATGAFNVARACAANDALCAYISTDYVFDGTKSTPYVEGDEPHPVNVYGISKLAGEQATFAYASAPLVVRVSSLFGIAGSRGKGGNFVEAILAKARAGESLTVVDDISMSPTYTVHAARALASLLEDARTGLFHLSNRGRCTWHEFASAIVEFAAIDAEVVPTTSDAYPSRARRPANSSLETSHAIPTAEWQQGLAAYLQEKGHLAAQSDAP